MYYLIKNKPILYEHIFYISQVYNIVQMNAELARCSLGLLPSIENNLKI